MKKLLLIATLLIGILTSAQDFEFLKKTYRSDIAFTREFADAVAINFRGDYSYLDARESKRGDVYSIVYIPKLASEETLKRIKESIDYAYSGECKECLQVHFKIFIEGGNADFEIAGTKRYMFNIFYGKFLDLLPFWKKYIAPNDSAEVKIDVSVYTRQIDHLKTMLELKTDISRLREERIWKLEDELKNLAREKFVFLN